jgi:hypothetical protein
MYNVFYWPSKFCIKIDFLIRNLISSPQRDIYPFSFPQATFLSLPAEFLVNPRPFILITALLSETNGGDLAFFGDFQFVIERFCSTIVQLLNLRYKSGTSVCSRTICSVQLEIMNLGLAR